MKVLLILLAVYPAIVVTHEMGHYCAAKWIDATVAEVSFGVGHKLYSWMRHGTVFTIRLFPIAGCILMKSAANCRKRAEMRKIFRRKPKREQMLVFLAGSGANLLCSAMLTVIMIAFPGFIYAYELRCVINVFLVAGIMNLLPFPRSDGYRMLELIFIWAYGKWKNGQQIRRSRKRHI